MAAQAQTDADELRLHKEAYLILFENILKNRYSDPAAVQATMGELRTFIDQRVSNPDAIIEYIPPLARKLALREDQLGAYIGQNFLKALGVAQEKAKQAAAGKVNKSIPTDALAQDGPILEAILTAFGAFVQGPDHFEMLDNGAVKLVRKGKDVLPASSANTAEDAADFANVTGGEEADEVDEFEDESSGPPAPAAAAPGAKAAIAVRQERSLIAEILDRFGMDVQQKLIPQDFTEEGEDFVVEESASESEGDENLEPMLIEEILRRFGNVLNVHEKLVPVEYSGDEDEGLFDGGAGDGDSGEAADSDVWAETGMEVDPIPVVLTSFAALRNRLADFQRRQDRSGYQEYLSGASDDIKATVALINLASRALKQPQLAVEDEFFRLSSTMPYSADQLRDLYGRIERYGRATATLNEFLNRVKQANPAIQVEIRKIWRQVLDILDEDSGEAVARQRCRILLLAVNPAVKAQVETGIMSLISRVSAQ